MARRLFIVLPFLLSVAGGNAAPLSIGFAKDKDRSVEVRDGGVMLASYSAVKLGYSGRRYRFVNGSAVEIESGYEVTYRAPDDFPKGFSLPVVKGRFVRTAGGAVDVRFTVVNVATNDGFSASCILARRHGSSLVRGTCLKGQGRWVRSENGGQPWEERLDNALEFVDADGGGIAYISSRQESGEPRWCGPWEHHVRFVQDEEAGGWVTRFRLVRVDAVRTPYAQVCAAAGMPAQVTLRTVKTYNWFECASGEIVFTGEILNVQDSARRFEVSWWVRGFSGERFGEGRQTVEVPSFGTVAVPAGFDPKEPRGLYFVEMRARDCADGREVFDRMNIARLPPHKFRAKPENSPFGICGDFPIPDEESLQKLLDRMGVMWVRHGDTRLQHPPRVAWRHSGNHALNKYKESGPEREKWIIGEFETCRTNRNEYWEFGNELNGAVPGIGLKCHGIGLAVKAPEYVDFLKDIHRIRKERGYEDINIISLGLAGYDSVFVRRIKELGGWECLDGFALHPGRGNFTPDYPYFRPETFLVNAAQSTDDPRATEKLSHSSYWNFLGSVRGAQKQIREYGDMPLWLTEVYTPGAPNTFWDDNLHDSADNVVLMYTLIKADGVKCGFFYQMFDGVWFDKLGVNPKNREYFFGMMTRDLSFKPSMMAYCNIAEALDEATFAGWMKSGNKTTHAALFRTPRGHMAVIWDRTEGMILNSWNRGMTPWPSPNPWVGSWKKRIAYDIPVKGRVMAINSIGQRFDVPVSGGEAHLQLTGSPLIVYGVDLGRLSIVR